jgi:Ca2+-binding RTX toxin-like protein
LTDKVVVSAAGLGGGLTPDFAVSFVSGVTPVANAAAAQFLYDTSTGWLYFDIDGTGSGVAIHFATLSDLAPLAETDFLIAACMRLVGMSSIELLLTIPK